MWFWTQYECLKGLCNTIENVIYIIYLNLFIIHFPLIYAEICRNGVKSYSFNQSINLIYFQIVHLTSLTWFTFRRYMAEICRYGVNNYSINQSYLLSYSSFYIFNMIRFVINTSFVNRWFLHIFNQNLNIERKRNFDRAYKDVYLSLKRLNVWIFLRKQYKDTWLKTQNNIQCTYIYSKSI